MITLFIPFTITDTNITMASSSSFSSSSSSPTKKKTAKISQIQQTLFQKPSSLKATSLIKRQDTVFKKAYELSTLCGIEVCVICYGLDGELKTWPKDREKVKDMARRYSELSETKRRKGRVDLRQFLEKINMDDSKKKKKKKKVVFRSSDKYPDWDPRFNHYSVEQLRVLIQSLERSLTIMQQRLRAVVESQKQRNMRNTNMADQEQMITTTNAAAMNHLQQHSNHVSMDLFNHANGTLSQIPVSASDFNQGKSLAPIPNSLMLYPNPLTIYPDLNAEIYSRLRGVQETGTSEFPSTSMLPYNININNNNSVNGFSKQFCQNYSGYLGVQETGINNTNVDDYPGLLWAQGTGINGLQNMDMYDYNSNINTNGLSNQLVQFPTQRAAPVFQYGSSTQQF